MKLFTFSDGSFIFFSYSLHPLDSPLYFTTGSKISSSVVLPFSQVFQTISFPFALTFYFLNPFSPDPSNVPHSLALPHFYLLLIPLLSFIFLQKERWVPGRTAPTYSHHPRGIKPVKCATLYLYLTQKPRLSSESLPHVWPARSTICYRNTEKRIHLPTNSTHAPIIKYNINI